MISSRLTKETLRKRRNGQEQRRIIQHEIEFVLGIDAVYLNRARRAKTHNRRN